MIPVRRRLLARLSAAEPRLVRLHAPPGHGKTEIALAYARRFERYATCDCTALRGAVDFAGRVLSALASESNGDESIARMRLYLHATGAGEAAWNQALLDGWKLRQERALLVIENADAIAYQPGALALLGDILAARPAERVLLLSSRNPVPLDVERYVAPHQILTLATNDLRFDGDEVASVFDGTDLPQATIDRIARLARGWPIALRLLARIAHYEADLEPLLDRLDAVADGLHEYLLNEILTAVTPDMMATMLAAAAVPNATLEDISLATGITHAAPIVEGLLRLPGFISSQSGTYRIHPLLHARLRARHAGDLVDFVLRAASGNERLGDFLRAAELFNAAGDSNSAARALNRILAEALRQPSPRMIDALARIPVATIVSHSNLWLALLDDRRRSVDASRLYDESTAFARTASPDASARLWRRLGVRRAMLACELGRLKEARATLESIGALDSRDETPDERRLALMTSAAVAARQGRFFDAECLLEEADGIYGARHLRFDDVRARIAVEKALAHGEWDDLLKISEERLAAAQRTGPAQHVADAARAVARAAWCRNDDERVADAQQIVTNCGVAGADSAEEAAVADLQAALTNADLERAVALADRAIERIDKSESNVLRILIRVGAALLVPAQRRRLIEARAIAQTIESPPLQAAIELLVDAPEVRDTGIFGHLAARVARSPLRARHSHLVVDVMRGRVRLGAEPLHVSDRGLELLAALALFDAGTTNEALATALWPALDRKAAVNALKMCLSRTRAQVGDRESIQNVRSGYTLGEHVDSDVREAQRLLRAVRGAGTLGESLCSRIRKLLDAWGEQRPAHTFDWTWFGPYATHLDDARRELARASIGAANGRDRTRIPEVAMP